MRYSLGLDIGTASLGYAVINEDVNRIEYVGVRIFEAPENPKNGESLALPRRTARSARRRLSRRRQRLDYLKNYFVSHNLLSAKEIANILDPTKEPKYDPYEMRSRGLKEELKNDELFVALYCIAKRRGYKSNRKKLEESDKENGRVLAAIKSNAGLFAEYETIGDALHKDERFSAKKRNKRDSYENSFIREDFEKEARKLLQKQGWSEKNIDELFHDPAKCWGGIFDQRPFMTEELIEKMRGNCIFEKGEKRGWKASYTFDLFRFTQDLINLTFISEDGEEHCVNEEQITRILKIAMDTKKVTYKRVRQVLEEDFGPISFKYIRGQKKDESDEKAETREFGSLKYYHEIKKCLTYNEFARIKSDIDSFDRIGYILTTCKDDKTIKKNLKEQNLCDESISKLLCVNFSGFAHLSIKALRKLTVHLLKGETYDKAVELVYPGEFSAKFSGDANKLPPLGEEELSQITNPVVKRAIGQTRKVINAIIGKYGAPTQIKIECTNELAKSFKDRKKIHDNQEENRRANEIRVEKLKELGIVNPTGQQILKYRLREEQLGKCAYCGRLLGTDIFTDDKLAEVDHIIPFSRCGNDSNSNKALVCSRCNQEKSSQTPFEKWGSDVEHWEAIKNLAYNLNIANQHVKNIKVKRILAEKAPKEEWNSRALNDTRYVMRFMANYIKKNLKFSDEGKGKQKVVLPTGFIVNYLRKMYHLGHKDRELNNCHHAVDACIIATVSQGQIQKFAKWNRCKEEGARWKTEIYYKSETGETVQITKKEYEEMTAELKPWKDFDKEVEIRCGMTCDQSKIEDEQEFRDKLKSFESYDEKFLSKVKPIFVSRMPKRSAKGSAHKETIRSVKAKDNGDRLTRRRLDKDFTLDQLNKSVLVESDKVLYEQLKRLLLEKGKDAFNEPVYKNGKKFDKNGRPLSPVTSVKVYSNEPSGILINHGTQFVNNGDTVRLEVYCRKNDDGSYSYYGAPVYVHAVNKKGPREILPTPNGRSKAEKVMYDAMRTVDGKIFADAKFGFEKVADVYPNDYVRALIKRRGGANEVVEGYYIKYNIANSRVSLVMHSTVGKDDKNFAGFNFGSVLSFELLNISLLGDNYRPANKAE